MGDAQWHVSGGAISASLWARRRRRRGEEAGSSSAEGAEVLIEWRGPSSAPRDPPFPISSSTIQPPRSRRSRFWGAEVVNLTEIEPQEITDADVGAAGFDTVEELMAPVRPVARSPLPRGSPFRRTRSPGSASQPGRARHGTGPAQDTVGANGRPGRKAMDPGDPGVDPVQSGARLHGAGGGDGPGSFPTSSAG